MPTPSGAPRGPAFPGPQKGFPPAADFGENARDQHPNHPMDPDRQNELEALRPDLLRFARL